MGLTTFTVSPAIVVDDTPPSSVRPAVLVSNVIGPLRRFWGYAHFVDFAAGFTDYETGVNRMYASVTSEAQSNVSLMEALVTELWQGGRLLVSVPLASGASYHLSVCAVDRLNLQSCSSSPFTVDLQPPNCTVLTDRINGIEAPAFFYLAGALSASWTCSDATSQVAKVEWMVYSSPAKDASQRTPLKAQSHPGGAGQGTATFSVQDGLRYSNCVVAVDLAGWHSVPLCSVGAIYDSTPPSAGTVTNGGGEPFFSSAPCTSWAGVTDPHSGVDKLTLRLFMVEGDSETEAADPHLVFSPLNNGNTCYLLQNATTLQHGVSYFTEMVVHSGAGATAEARTIVWALDTTAPEEGVVLLQLIYPTAFQDQPSFPASISGVSLRVSTRGFTDPESGIESCAFIVSDALGQVVATGITTPAAPSLNITLPGDVLNGTLLTATATCTNRVGNATDPVASEPWLVLLQAIDVGEAWIVDSKGRRVESDFVTERHAMWLRYTGANNPSSVDTHFQYTWGIVEAPCNVHAGDTKLKMQGSIRPQGLDDFPPAMGVLQTAAWKHNLLMLGRTRCSRLITGPEVPILPLDLKWTL